MPSSRDTVSSSGVHEVARLNHVTNLSGSITSSSRSGSGSVSSLPAARPSRRETAFNAAFMAMIAFREAAGAVPVPAVKAAASLACFIMDTIQNTKDVKNDYKRLAGNVQEVISATVMEEDRYHNAGSTNEEISQIMGKGLNELHDTLKDIYDFIAEQQSRGTLVRALFSKADVGKVKEFRDRLDHAMALFNIKISIDTNQTTHRLENMLGKIYEVQKRQELALKEAKEREIAATQERERENARLLAEIERVRRDREGQPAGAPQQQAARDANSLYFQQQMLSPPLTESPVPSRGSSAERMRTSSNTSPTAPNQTPSSPWDQSQSQPSQQSRNPYSGYPTPHQSPNSPNFDSAYPGGMPPNQGYAPYNDYSNQGYPNQGYPSPPQSPGYQSLPMNQMYPNFPPPPWGHFAQRPQAGAITPTITGASGPITMNSIAGDQNNTNNSHNITNNNSGTNNTTYTIGSNNDNSYHDNSTRTVHRGPINYGRGPRRGT